VIAPPPSVKKRLDVTHGLPRSGAWTNWTTIAPSPTAVAQRLVEPERTSPAAKTPGMLVSSRRRVRIGAREDEAVLVARNRVAEAIGAWCRSA